MDTSSKSLNNAAVILVSHGSSLPYAEVTFSEIKDKFYKATGIPTEVGYMKVAEPSISGAVENLKEEDHGAFGGFGDTNPARFGKSPA